MSTFDFPNAHPPHTPLTPTQIPHTPTPTYKYISVLIALITFMTGVKINNRSFHVHCTSSLLFASLAYKVLACSFCVICY